VTATSFQGWRLTGLGYLSTDPGEIAVSPMIILRIALGSRAEAPLSGGQRTGDRALGMQVPGVSRRNAGFGESNPDIQLGRLISYH
jgi:hypothetical protein